MESYLFFPITPLPTQPPSVYTAPGPPPHPLQESSEIMHGLQSRGSLTILTLGPRDTSHFRNAEKHQHATILPQKSNLSQEMSVLCPPFFFLTIVTPVGRELMESLTPRWGGGEMTWRWGEMTLRSAEAVREPGLKEHRWMASGLQTKCHMVQDVNRDKFGK